ncbi:SDR family NAD(P)-dependent oxidoreductase [Streptomyces sp. NPDC096934]|uniref:SDR family NAD(P)-dependent oxidoreductase n=1 Tax=Streptomyces sp. NPDC096934 TaxID=3155551 RepID=UPI00332CF5FE
MFQNEATLDFDHNLFSSFDAEVDAPLRERSTGEGHDGVNAVEGLKAALRVTEVNFFGGLNTTAAALPHLHATRGRVLNVSSVGGVVGKPLLTFVA